MRSCASHCSAEIRPPGTDVRTMHEYDKWQLLRGPGAADVTVVLLVDPVELEQGDAVRLERSAARGELARPVTAELPARPLDVLDATRLHLL